MDFTQSDNKIKTTFYINGESVNYTFVTLFAPIIYFFFARVPAIFINENICKWTAIGITVIYYFLMLNKFAFIKSQRKLPIRIIMFACLCAFDVGIFYLIPYAFKLMNLKSGFLDITYGFISYVIVFYLNWYISKFFIFKSSVDSKKRINGRLYKTFYSNRFVVLSMFAAAFILLFVYLCNQAYPFGDTSILRMDLYHQYGPLFGELYDRIIDGQSLQYSWVSGGGSNFLGNFFNYLSSPINLIIFLFKRSQLVSAISIIILIKAVLSAGSFTLFLKHSQNRHSCTTASFGVLYTFCGYFLAYYWNVMWLDAMYLLPMIALGIEFIIKKRKYGLYLISLALLMFSSYYMSFIVCIFAVLYFLVYYFSNYNFTQSVSSVDKNDKWIIKLFKSNFFTAGITFAYASIMAAAIAAIALLPTFFALQSCSATSNPFPTDATIYFDFFDFLTNHLAGVETTIRSSGGDVLPNIYSGVIVLILIPLYMMNKSIRLREKTAYTLLLSFFAISFNSNILNFIWHGFHFPNDLPYRFSFLYTFIILTMSFKLLTRLKYTDKKDIMLVGMLVMLFAAFAEKMPTKYYTEGLTFFVSVGFVMIYVLILTLIKNKRFASGAMASILLVCISSEILIGSTYSYNFTQPLSGYTYDYDALNEAIDYIEENDDGLYRTERTYLRTRMDPCWYGYNGMSTFSSMAYENFSGLQYSLGMFGNRINSYTYNPQTPLYNAMFSLKYLMWTNSSSIPSKSYYDELWLGSKTGDSQVKVYENKYSLPIAFRVNNGVHSWDYEEGNPFDVQNSFFMNAYASDDELFKPVEVTDCYSTNLNNFYVNSGENFIYEKTTDGLSALANIEIAANQNGNIYLYVNSPSATHLTVNSQNGTFEQDIDEPYILDIGYYEKGNIANIEINVGEQASSNISFYAYSMNDMLFKSAYKKFNQEGLNVTEHTDRYIKGTVNAQSSGIMYTSIPYDKGWTVLIDGEKVETVALADALLAFDLPNGSHTIEFKFSAKGLKLGAAVSALSVILAASLYCIESRRKKEIIVK